MAVNHSVKKSVKNVANVNSLHTMVKTEERGGKGWVGVGVSRGS